jgi:putative transcriptional regulator
MGMLMTCEETAAALSDYQDGILPLNQFLKVRVHLFNCPGCRILQATLRAMPGLVAGALALDAEAPAQARLALAGALARLGRPASRSWAATPIPLEARRVLEAGPDLAMRLLARTHDLITRERSPLARGCHLPQGTLDQLPGEEHWRWQEDRNGGRRAELLTDPPSGLRLLLVYAPPGSTLPPHRHLGSESILVLDGGMDDLGRDCGQGDWIHHPDGSCHAPRVASSGCWYLVREEGTVRFLGPADWPLRTAS